MSTLSVLVLLFGYHTSTSSTMASTPASSYQSGSEPGIASGGTYSGPTAAAAGPGGPRSSAPSSPHKAKVRARTVKGELVGTQWGPMQVAITVKGGAITGVSVPVRTSGNSRDDQIDAYALPILARETIDKQSARIDMVSGATVTSTGYVQSLQSALDKAGL
jgi:uncharacterized protein with FMN-binding domain